MLALIFPLLLWFLFSIRFYPNDLTKTLWETAKIFIGSGLWSLGILLIVNGLLHRFSQRSLEPRSLLRWVLWLSVITSLSASIEHYLRMKP